MFCPFIWRARPKTVAQGTHSRGPRGCSAALGQGTRKQSAETLGKIYPTTTRKKLKQCPPGRGGPWETTETIQKEKKQEQGQKEVKTIHTKNCAPVFTAAQLTRVKKWERPKGPRLLDG